MQILENPHRGKISPIISLSEIPYPSTDAQVSMDTLSSFSEYQPTPLLSKPELAGLAGVHQVFVKDESQRMTLGHFKALGAPYVLAKMNAQAPIKDQTFVCASAGNHGMAVALGAREFGANAVIYLDENVPMPFENRLKSENAQVVRVVGDYEHAMSEAKKAAQVNEWTLLSDSSWPGYTEIPYGVMEGYLTMMLEVINEAKTTPTHIYLHAGVGGMAAACAALSREIWGNETIIIVVEPDRAPALHHAIAHDTIETAGSGVSSMGRLDCKEPSFIALKGLSRDADYFALIDEDEAQNGVLEAQKLGLATTPSGGAGISALLASDSAKNALRLNEHSTILVIMSEGKV